MLTLRSLRALSFIVSLATSSLLIAAPSLDAAEEAATRQESVELLFVQTASGAAIDQERQTLTLSGASPTTLYFSDRPFRLAGHYTMAEFLQLWTEGKDSFLADPPNATLSVFVPGMEDPVEVVVELKGIEVSGTDIVYRVAVLQGDLPEASGPASLFIDIIGMPLTPMSYAGVARRWTRRAILY